MLECILVICLAGFLFTPNDEGRPVYRILGWQSSEEGLYKIARHGFTRDDRRNAQSQLVNLSFTGKKMFAAYYLGLLYSNSDGEFYSLESALEAFRIGAKKGHIGSEICFTTVSYLLNPEDTTAEFIDYLKYRPRFKPEELPLIMRALAKANGLLSNNAQIKEVLAAIEKRTPIPHTTWYA